MKEAALSALLLMEVLQEKVVEVHPLALVEVEEVAVEVSEVVVEAAVEVMAVEEVQAFQVVEEVVAAEKIAEQLPEMELEAVVVEVLSEMKRN